MIVLKLQNVIVLWNQCIGKNATDEIILLHVEENLININ
jgi:hypothetical protein